MRRIMCVDFTLKENVKSNDQDRKQFESFFNKKYQAYRHDSLYYGKYLYRIEEEKENLEEVLHIIKPYEDQYDFSIWMENVYEDNDFDHAVAFRLDFPYGCEEYDNEEELEVFETETTLCEECFAKEKKDKTYFQIDSDWAGNFKKEYKGISSNNSDYLVSTLLYAFLIDNKVAEDNFRPVYDLDENIVAYRFYGEKSTLPPLSIISYRTECVSKCPVCHRSIIEPQWDLDVDENKLWHSVQAQYKVGPFSKKIVSAINSQGLNVLEMVNQTHEYRRFRRQIIINKELFDLIALKWPDVKFYVEPIFKENFKADVDPSNGRVFKVNK